MSDATTSELAEAADSETIDKRARDRARMKRAAVRHGAAVLAALTLFGAGELWALQSGLTIAVIVSLGNALLAGYVLASIIHEWGHFTGARLSGARSPVAAEVTGPFMFGFDMKRNSLNQFLALSFGGPIANWTLVFAIALLVPMNSLAAALLLATTVGVAVNVCVFEVPVIRDAMSGADPDETIQQRLRDTAASPRYHGLIAGGAVWLAVIYMAGLAG